MVSAKIEVKCPKCGKLFQSEEEMLEHYEADHDGKDEPKHKRHFPKKKALLAAAIISILVLSLFLFGYSVVNQRTVAASQKTDSDGDGITDWNEIHVTHTNPNNIYTSQVVVNGTYRLDDFNAIKTYGIDPHNDSAVREFMWRIPNVVANHWNKTDVTDNNNFDKYVEISTRDPLIQWLGRHSEIKWTIYPDGSKHGQLYVNEQKVFFPECNDSQLGFVDQPSYYFTHQRGGVCVENNLASFSIASIMNIPIVHLTGDVPYKDTRAAHSWSEILVDGVVFVLSNGDIWPRDGWYDNGLWTPDEPYDPDWYMK